MKSVLLAAVLSTLCLGAFAGCGSQPDEATRNYKGPGPAKSANVPSLKLNGNNLMQGKQGK